MDEIAFSGKSPPPAGRGRRMYAAALLLFLAGAGGLVFLGASENGTYFRTVSEALSMPRERLAAVRLFGTVQEEGLHSFAQGLGVRFQLKDGEDAAKALWVVFRGAVPEAFQAGAEVIVEGGFAPEGTDFLARTLMTKCPSKYQKENRERGV